MVNIILANAGTVVCFRTGSPEDEKRMLPLFKPYIEEGEINNLPSFNFYMRVATQTYQEPFSGMTIALEDAGDEVIRERVIERSRQNYAARHIAPTVKENEPVADTVEEKKWAKRKPGDKKKVNDPKRKPLVTGPFPEKRRLK